MKKIKMIIGALLLSLSLASCSMLNGGGGTSATKKADTPSVSTSKAKEKISSSVQSVSSKYNVTFETNGGTIVSSQKIESGNTATKPSDPTKKGYTFIGWYSDEALNTLYDFASAVNNDITLYAKWAIDTFTVSFDVKGGSETIDDQTVEYNSTVTKPTDPTKDGYTFGGWYTSSYYLTEYNFSSKVTKSITLYAKWNEIPKTVKYEVGEPSVEIWTDSINVKWIKVSVPVTNTGTADLYLDDATIDIESSTGTLLDTLSYVGGYPEYIKPGETGYYYEDNFAEFSNNDVVAVPHVKVEKATNDVIRYDVTDVTITSDIYGIKVMGRVQNNTTKKESLVMLAANLFDTNEKLICNCFTYLDGSLAAGAKVGFTISSYSTDDFSPEDVASYEVYAYPVQYNW